MRINYLERLLEITKEQKKLLYEDKYEEFIQYLERRQEIIKKLEEINAEKGVPLDEEERSILLQVIDIDKGNSKEYNRQLDEVKEKLKELNNSKSRDIGYMGVYMNYGLGRNFDTK